VFSHAIGSKFRDMLDGTSNVVVLGEVAMKDRRINEFIGNVGTQIPNAAVPGDPCAGGYDLSTGLLSGSQMFEISQRWHDGAAFYGGFTTNYGPNGPSCAGRIGTPPQFAVIVPASAYHPGGAMHAFGDGRIRFLTETIDQIVYQRLGQKADGNPVEIPD
jgi:hypothetical protein